MNKLQCMNSYCIYENDGECILDKISLNDAGMCEECILVSIDRDELKKMKKRLLNHFKKMDSC